MTGADLTPLARYTVLARGHQASATFLGLSPTPCLVFRTDDGDVIHLHEEDLTGALIDTARPGWLPPLPGQDDDS